MTISRFCCYRRFAAALAALSFSACDIDFSRGRFECKHGEACPPGLVCGLDFVCTSQLGRCSSELQCAAGEYCGDDGACRTRALDGSVLDPSADGGRTLTEEKALQCEPDALRCDSGNTPQRCVQNSWVSLAACGGTTPACTNGICGVAKVAGGLASGGADVDGPRYRLVAHGLDRVERICAKAVNGADICVVGGIKP